MMKHMSITVLALLSATLWTATKALDCNICGPGTQNSIGKADGSVELVYEGKNLKQNCQKWQESQLISDEWCEENMLKLTVDVCKCLTPEGNLVKDAIVFPTMSPAPTTYWPTGPTGGNTAPVAPVGSPPTSEASPSPMRLLYIQTFSVMLFGAVAGL